jgi:hypothetical protein
MRVITLLLSPRYQIFSEAMPRKIVVKVMAKMVKVMH